MKGQVTSDDDADLEIDPMDGGNIGPDNRPYSSYSFRELYEIVVGYPDQIKFTHPAYQAFTIHCCKFYMEEDHIDILVMLKNQTQEESQKRII